MDVVQFFGGWVMVIAIVVIVPVVVLIGFSLIPAIGAFLVARRLRMGTNRAAVAAVVTLALSAAFLRTPTGIDLVDQIWPQAATWLKVLDHRHVRNELGQRSPPSSRR